MIDCECKNWARSSNAYNIKTRDGIPLMTDHHPNCSHYNDSLMDVWKLVFNGQKCYFGNEEDAENDAKTIVAESGGETVAICKEKMHREIFKNLPEFDGF